VIAWLIDHWLLFIAIGGIYHAGYYRGAMVFRAMLPWLGVAIMVLITDLPWYGILPIAFVSSTLWLGVTDAIRDRKRRG